MPPEPLSTVCALLGPRPSLAGRPKGICSHTMCASREKPTPLAEPRQACTVLWRVGALIADPATVAILAQSASLRVVRVQCAVWAMAAGSEDV